MLIKSSFLLTFIFLSACSSPKVNVGLIDGKLRPCPESPNCVSTQSTQEEKIMKPLSFSLSLDEMKKKIKSVLLQLPRTTLVTEEKNYLHFEFKSLIFRWVDDVEFLIDENQNKVHFRSASRVGHSDLGVNRKRMDELLLKLK
ncbi:MAG: DUF1499 domain-containing protein [Bacteriovoracaceae bacterium]